MADWSLLPKDLLQLISSRLETCFEIVQFRSVCISWWSIVPNSSSDRRGLGCKIRFPDFNIYNCDENCVLKKSPVYLFRFQTPFGADYFIAGMSEMVHGKQMLISPLKDYGYTSQCNLFLNTLNSQIISLGHSYKLYATVEFHYRTRRRRTSMSVAFLPLDNDDFAMMVGVVEDVMMYRSSDKKWIAIEALYKSYKDMVSFKGKFYVIDESGRGHVFVIEPSLEVTEINLVTQSYDEPCWETLVVSKEELLLVQGFTPGEDIEEHMYIWFRVFKLEEKCKRLVRVNDLKDQIVFLGSDWNICYSARELPGTKGNCIVFEECFGDKSGIFLFELRTRTTYECNQWSSYMGAFGKNKEYLKSSGILTIPNQENTSYDFLPSQWW